MVDSKLVKKLKDNVKLTNFIDGFNYLKHAGYDEMAAFFNSLTAFEDALVPPSEKIVKLKHNNDIGYAFLISKNKHVNNFIAFCVENNYEFNGVISGTVTTKFTYEALAEYFESLLKKYSDIPRISPVRYNFSHYRKLIFGEVNAENLDVDILYLDDDDADLPF